MRCILAVMLVGCTAWPTTGPVVPLPRAHAHNDYVHERPLFDALAQGFCSVEVDIHLVDGELLVGHDREDVDPSRTIESLYLEPLLHRVRENGGRVYPGGPEFTLLIDVKSEGPATYRVLNEVLAKYRELLSEVSDGELEVRAVRAILTGNRPRALMERTRVRHVGYDGRLTDLFQPDFLRPAKPHFIPLISDRWSDHFQWKGAGPLPADEQIKLDLIVATAHRDGQRVRFWATPGNEAVWGVLYTAGVDLINADDLVALRRFLIRRRTREPAPQGTPQIPGR